MGDLDNISNDCHIILNESMEIQNLIISNESTENNGF